MDKGIVFKEADFLLKRDWALDTNDIDEMLWRLVNDEEFQKVLDHYFEYPTRVQLLLDQYFPKQSIKNGFHVLELEDVIQNGK